MAYPSTTSPGAGPGVSESPDREAGEGLLQLRVEVADGTGAAGREISTRPAVRSRATGSARAGMFARGEFEIGQTQGLSLPQSAVLLREGFSYVLQVGPDSKVQQVKVSTGRRWADRVEITGGVERNARVVASGGGFLGDGDLVRVVDAAPAAAQKTASK